MQVRRIEDPANWLALVTPLLSRDEARHNLLFGIADTLIHRPHAYARHSVWIAAENDRVTGVALRTPPYNVIVATPDGGSVPDALAEALVTAGEDLPGVSGVRSDAEAFADAWVARAGGTWHVRMTQGVYRLDEVRPVPATSGAARVAGPDDEPVLLDLVQAFADESLPDTMRDPESTRRTVAGHLVADAAQGGFWIWEDRGRAVSISGHGGRTPSGIRIGPVYTPPDVRGRGYATGLVAAQSAWLLALGRRFCFLYTDLANPTSNGIYRRIGYVQRHEALDIGFERAAPA